VIYLSSCVCLFDAWVRIIESGELPITKHVGFAGLSFDKPAMSTINKLAYSLELLIHGSPSGVDNSVATYGGAVSFLKGKITHFSRLVLLALLGVACRAFCSCTIANDVVKFAFVSTFI